MKGSRRGRCDATSWALFFRQSAEKRLSICSLPTLDDCVVDKSGVNTAFQIPLALRHFIIGFVSCEYEYLLSR